MAFNIKMELAIGQGGGEGLLVSDLNIEYKIERSIKYAENTAEFTVYNMKKETRGKVVEESDLVFKLAYADHIKDPTNLPALFIGNVIDPKHRRTGADWITTFAGVLMKSKKLPRRLKQVVFSYTPDIFLSQVLKDIGTTLGLVVLGSENAEFVLDNGFAYIGSTRGALNYCREILESKGCGLYIDNAEIVIYKEGEETSRFSAVYLDYESGLVSVSDVTDYSDPHRADKKRIEFVSLVNPNLVPNGLVKIDKVPGYEGVYLIERLVFEGNNFGGQNICTGEAVE